MPDMRCKECHGVFWWIHERDYCNKCKAKLELGLLK
jgi:hypothetical protein